MFMWCPYLFVNMSWLAQNTTEETRQPQAFRNPLPSASKTLIKDAWQFVYVSVFLLQGIVGCSHD